MLFRSDRKSTRLNSSHTIISYAVFCLKKNRTPPRTSFPPAGTPGGSLFARSRRAAHGPSSARRPARELCSRLSIGVAFFFFKDTATPGVHPFSLPPPPPI